MIDTSQLRPTQLRQWMRELVQASGNRLTLAFESFAFKHGVPLAADFVFDVRVLPNPHYIRELQPLTGRDAPVAEYLQAQPEVGIVTTDAWILADDTLTTRRYYADHLGSAFPAAGDQLRTVAAHNFVFVGAVVRREVFDRIGTLDESLRRAEDYDLWCRALLAGERIGLVDEPLAQYRVRPDSLSANREAQWDAHLTVLAKHIEALASQGVFVEPTAAYDLAHRAAAAGERRIAARRYRIAAKGVPPLRAARLYAAALRAYFGG